MLVLVGATNAVNLTDGLDGLAISTFAIVAAAFTALAYVTGHRVLADYLLLVRFPPAAELTIFCGALVGASLGFLWYNSYPADIFMGDVGSLALGGALGTVAILIKQELLLADRRRRVRRSKRCPSIIQVASFKLTGKRVFKMAPLHHHFELVGWSEPKVITRFVIVGDHLRAVQPDDVEAAMMAWRLLTRRRASGWWSSARRAAEWRPRSCCARRGARVTLTDRTPRDRRGAARWRVSGVALELGGTSRRDVDASGPDRGEPGRAARPAGAARGARGRRAGHRRAGARVAVAARARRSRSPARKGSRRRRR